jgi:hypothetical protein
MDLTGLLVYLVLCVTLLVPIAIVQGVIKEPSHRWHGRYYKTVRVSFWVLCW